MRDSQSVITNAVRDIPIADLAAEMDVSIPRMYEMLADQCTYPKSKKLIRAIGKLSPKGARLIRADFDAMMCELLGETREESTAVELHKEAFEAIQACLENKPCGDRARELRELIAVAQGMLVEIEIDKRTHSREAFSVVGGK